MPRYTPSDFKVKRGFEETGDRRIAYVFESRDGRVEASLIWRPDDVEMRVLVWDPRRESADASAVAFPFLNRRGRGALPPPERFVRALVRHLERGRTGNPLRPARRGAPVGLGYSAVYGNVFAGPDELDALLAEGRGTVWSEVSGRLGARMVSDYVVQVHDPAEDPDAVPPDERTLLELPSNPLRAPGPAEEPHARWVRGHESGSPPGEPVPDFTTNPRAMFHPELVWNIDKLRETRESRGRAAVREGAGGAEPSGARRASSPAAERLAELERERARRVRAGEVREAGLLNPARGRTLTFEFRGAAVPLRMVRVDRNALYGRVESETLDDRGRRSVLAKVAADGRTLIGSGGTALAMMSPEGEWLSRDKLTPVGLDGKIIEPVKSSFAAPIRLEREATVDEFLEHDIRSVYLLRPETEGADAELLDALKAGRVFRFQFSYKGGLEADEGFLLAGREGDIFLCVGKPTKVRFVGLAQAAEVEDEEVEEPDEAEMEITEEFMEMM